MLSHAYFPSHAENRMESEGDLVAARDVFLKRRPNNLTALLRLRYSWMNRYLEGRERVVELGAGAGFSKFFLNAPQLILTDYEQYPWIDQAVDALHTPFEDRSVDVVIASHMIHHLASPMKFFREMRRILKSSGRILIQEINTSLLMRVLLRIMRHEGWSYAVDVFDENVIANDPSDPWSANCAIPELLFRDSDRFENAVPWFKVELNRVCECLLFPLSGGVIAKTKTVNLPKPILSLVEGMDSLLVRGCPGLFALGRSVVLRANA